MQTKDQEDIKDDARNLIIQSARNIFGRFGYRKTTLEDIAKEAKKGKSSLYYYFDSKEELYMEVVKIEAKELSEGIMKVLKQIVDPRESLYRYIYERTVRIGQFETLHEAVKDSSITDMEFITPLRDRYLEDEISIIERFLKQGVSYGIFDIPNPTLVANTLVIAIKGYDQPIIQRKFGLESFNEKLHSLISLLLKGITSDIERKRNYHLPLVENAVD
ncbi:TetR/AcrR family transcriptional regulator [Halosquirtibacter xylanolyticus]|uniref:TetR/AcrR family transcriptional regulator n=1 Tax=Halosquirtibacter xylanolyticus TaxID=3374599 RepID=UPI00374830B2|nr:TetR/AcrR family transcriptional regulator [Prolixibacteraceae bacterium]